MRLYIVNTQSNRREKKCKTSIQIVWIYNTTISSRTYILLNTYLLFLKTSYDANEYISQVTVGSLYRTRILCLAGAKVNYTNLVNFATPRTCKIQSVNSGP